MITQNQFFDLITCHFKTRAKAFEAIGEALHLTPGAVKKIVNGTTLLTYDRLAKLLRHFGIRPEQMFTAISTLSMRATSASTPTRPTIIWPICGPC